jgi:hypothetical protein
MSKPHECVFVPYVIAAFLALHCFAPRAEAFKSRTHTRITSGVLSGLGFDSDSVVRVTAASDLVDINGAGGESDVPEAHFDNETFSKGSKRLRDKIAAILDALDTGNRSLALEELGRGLHTVQDFFSHSNFIENNSVDTAVDLLNLEDPSPDLVCDRKTFKGGLTSGDYPERRADGKCTHTELNKEDARAGQRYDLAVEKAVLESRHYVRSVLAAIDSRPSWDNARRLEMKKLLLNQVWDWQAGAIPARPGALA